MADISPPPFSSFASWTGWAALFAAIGGAAGAWFKQRVPLKKVEMEAEERFQAILLQRVEGVEADMKRERAKHEAERALDRHKIRNLTQCLDALLMILETAPEKAVEVVAKVRAMRDAQIKAEAIEAAQIHAAEIAGGDQ
ncbi:hypothetical protein [Novosphingobium rosa]|uniref:hypothetical protein n=1 Tax=Novosphingobium rosa TaxID=76978 RepID=UPI0008356412|nr:hypothetical protein [Novosphingobium rosa]